MFKGRMGFAIVIFALIGLGVTVILGQLEMLRFSIPMLIGGLLGGAVGGGLIWAALNAMTGGWFDRTHTLPGFGAGLILAMILGYFMFNYMRLNDSEVLAVLIGLSALPIIGIIMGIFRDRRAKRRADALAADPVAAANAARAEAEAAARGAPSYLDSGSWKFGFIGGLLVGAFVAFPLGLNFDLPRIAIIVLMILFAVLGVWVGKRFHVRFHRHAEKARERHGFDAPAAAPTGAAAEDEDEDGFVAGAPDPESPKGTH